MVGSWPEALFWGAFGGIAGALLTYMGAVRGSDKTVMERMATRKWQLTLAVAALFAGGFTVAHYKSMPSMTALAAMNLGIAWPLGAGTAASASPKANYKAD